MKNIAFAAAATLALALPASAEEGEASHPSPNEIVAQASPEEWIAIAPEDLLVMRLAPDAEGREREVVIQLVPAPFSEGWVENIRTFARARWYDGISVNRVQDNYVVQWGDPNYDNPEAEGEAKPLPEGLKVVSEAQYTASLTESMSDELSGKVADGLRAVLASEDEPATIENDRIRSALRQTYLRSDPYSQFNFALGGWPVAIDADQATAWPVHCYGMVGVGRGYSPDTGSGAELYTVIGHAPRHLDRNIALVGRIISGMEHLSSLPRGSGALGFYTQEEFDKRTPILSVRMASDLPEAERPRFEYLSTEGGTFARYAEARANRRDPFFIHPAGGADICNIPVPVRAVARD